MMHRILIIVALVTLAACTRVQPIYNINDQSITTVSKKTLSQEEVRGAIIRAAVEKTWKVKDIDSSHMEATLNVRSHTAVVVIEYSPRSYSINYKSSSLLRQKGEQIHRRYNAWVKGLAIEIEKQLALL